MERLNIRKLFTCTGELNGLARNGLNAQRRAAPCVAVKLCYYNAGKLQLFIEGLCNVHRVLTGHRVYSQQYFRRLNRIPYCGDLVHHAFVYMQPTRGIDYNKILQLPACFLDAKLCRLHRVRLSALKHRNPYLGANDLQLVYCRGAIYIARHKHGRLAVLLGKITCKLARHCGFTRALKARKQNNAGAF